MSAGYPAPSAAVRTADRGRRTPAAAERSGARPDRRLFALAVGLSLLQLGLMVGQIALDQLATPGAAVLANDVFGAITVLAFPAVGAVILRRYPRHLVGWLFLVTNLPWAINGASGAWVRYGMTSGGLLPGIAVATWLYPWQGDLGFGLMIALLFVFPTGRLLSPAWRPAIWLLALVAGLGAAANAFLPGVVDPTIGVRVENPLGATGALAGLVVQAARWQFVAFMVPLGLGLAALVVRVYRSRGLERQQLKWFVWATGIFGSLLLAGVLFAPLGDSSNAFWVAALLVLPLIPLAAGLAILRYRLYDVDLVINRTLVYGSLTALLAVVYVATVLALGAVVTPFTGSSTFAVAASTLLVAALFQPARRAVQDVVDRRFYRRRYDATREISGFSALLRDEVDVERVGALLATTLERTVQPAFASIWLRPGAGR